MVSVDSGDEPERGARQQTWQPLSPHQAVAERDAYPRRLQCALHERDKLIKAIIAQMVSALSDSKAVGDVTRLSVWLRF